MAALLDIPLLREASQRRDVRVLHIVESLQDRAVESWLYRSFQRAVVEYPHIKWSFFCVLPEPGVFDERVKSAGGEVIYSRCRLQERVSFLRGLRKVIRNGNYDVLHCHHDITSAIYLFASIGLPVRKRIVHLHNTELSLPTPNKFKTLLLKQPMRQLCLRANNVVGISKDALNSILGNRPQREDRDLVVHYGINTESFRVPADDAVNWRRKFGLAPNAKVLLFAGRLVDYKNPIFAVQVLEQLRKRDRSFELLIAGTGPLSDSITALAADKKLEAYVHLAGFRNDVPTLMLHSDVFIWPSEEDPKEGLGLGIVEAQAAGLPIVMSRSVPNEAIVIDELVRVLPLAAGAEAWSDEIEKILNTLHPTREDCLSRVSASSFSMESGVASLIKLYDGLN